LNKWNYPKIKKKTNYLNFDMNTLKIIDKRLLFFYAIYGFIICSCSPSSIKNPIDVQIQVVELIPHPAIKAGDPRCGKYQIWFLLNRRSMGQILCLY